MTKEQSSPISTCSETVPSILSPILYPRHYEVDYVLPLLCPVNVAVSSLCVSVLYNNPIVLYTILNF